MTTVKITDGEDKYIEELITFRRNFFRNLDAGELRTIIFEAFDKIGVLTINDRQRKFTRVKPFNFSTKINMASVQSLLDDLKQSEEDGTEHPAEILLGDNKNETIRTLGRLLERYSATNNIKDFDNIRYDILKLLVVTPLANSFGKIALSPELAEAVDSYLSKAKLKKGLLVTLFVNMISYATEELKETELSTRPKEFIMNVNIL